MASVYAQWACGPCAGTGGGALTCVIPSERSESRDPLRTCDGVPRLPFASLRVARDDTMLNGAQFNIQHSTFMTFSEGAGAPVLRRAISICLKNTRTPPRAAALHD